MNMVKNLFSKITGLWESSESVIGLDIGSAFIKVVQLKKKMGKAVLETYGEIALGPYAGFEIGQATKLETKKIIEILTDLFRESKVSSRSAGLSIPLSSSLLAVISIPDVGIKQLSKIIPIEARKYIPVPISEVALDWWVIPTRETAGSSNNSGRKKVEVMVAAIHNQVISKYNEIMNKHNMKGGFLEIEAFSAIRATSGQFISPVMVLDLGAGTTKISMVEQGIIKNTHIINRGSQDLTTTLSKSRGISYGEAEKLKKEFGLLGEKENAEASEMFKSTLNNIFTSANRVLLNYERKYNKTVKQVVMVGGGALMKGILDEAKKVFETEIITGNPFSKIEAPAFLEPILKEAGPEFAVAIGLALKKLQMSS